MAPPKVMLGQSRQNTTTTMKKGVTTRSQNIVTSNVLNKQANIGRNIRGKRKAEVSPVKEKTTKRSAFGDLTNHTIGRSLEAKNHVVLQPELTKPKAVVRIKSRKTEEKTEPIVLPKIVNIRPSLDLEKSDDSSLYVSALEEVPDSVKRTLRSSNKIDENEEKIEKDEKKVEEKKEEIKASEEKSESEKKVSAAARLDAIPERQLPEGVQWDFDTEHWLDPFQVSHYAMDIFEYLKQRECLFPIKDYINEQITLSQWMRALLVDWLVEVQESFELNHETLYLAVKLVDLYLSKVTVDRETLQLLGAASLFIASKYDERIPPMVEDFLYICDGAYSQKELFRMEMDILKVVNFDLGIPLSYRFLRRYARCAKVSMPTLTLARYILEYSLMDYSMIMFSDSKMAAAALLLALQMKNLGGWTPTLEYYTGYKIDDIRNICNFLNQGLHRKYKGALMTIRRKYNHEIFFEVAKLPLKDKLDI